ncbi:hypothetical protein ACWDVV_23330, partial [Streptomyces tendae]
MPGQGGEHRCGDGARPAGRGRFLGAHGQAHVPVLQPPAQGDRLLDDLPADGTPAGDDLRQQAAADGAVVVGPGASSGEPGPDEGFEQGEAQRDGVGTVLVRPFEGPHQPRGDRRGTARQVPGEGDGVHGVGQQAGGALGHGELRTQGVRHHRVADDGSAVGGDEADVGGEHATGHGDQLRPLRAGGEPAQQVLDGAG